MPRYYFDRHEGGDLEVDTEGVNYEDDEQARVAATRACGEWLRDAGTQVDAGSEWRMDVLDASRAVIFTLRVTAENPR